MVYFDELFSVLRDTDFEIPSNQQLYVDMDSFLLYVDLGHNFCLLV
jgi:hypothetical protein